MCRYKPGDKVRIKTTLIPGESYDGLLFTEEMTEYKGRVLTITKILEYDDRFECAEAYEESKFSGRKYVWKWNEEMVEPYTANHYTTEDIGACMRKSD